MVFFMKRHSENHEEKQDENTVNADRTDFYRQSSLDAKLKFIDEKWGIYVCTLSITVHM